MAFGDDLLANNPLMMIQAMGGMNAMPGAATPRTAMGNVYSRMAPIRAAATLARMGHMRIGPGGRQQQGGNPLSGGIDPSAFTDPSFQQHANALLQPYGLSVPQQASPFAMFPNSGTFANHPRLFGALESAMYGFANTQPGYTTGEQIANGFQGALAGQAQRHAAIRAPFEAPFQMAQQMEQLRDLGDKHQLNEAMIQWHRAQTNRLNQAPPEKQDKYAFHQIDKDGNLVGVRHDGTVEKLGDPGAFMPPHHAQDASEKVPTALVPYFKSMGVSDPTVASPEQWMRVQKMYQRDQVDLAAGRAGAGQHARNEVGFRDETLETKPEKAKRDAMDRKQKFMDAPRKASDWRQKGLKPGDMSGLSSWYDKNRNIIEGSAPSPMPQGAAPTSTTPASKRVPKYNPNTGEFE